MVRSNSALKHSEPSADAGLSELDAVAVERIAKALGSDDSIFTSEDAAWIMKNAYQNHPQIAAQLLKQLASEQTELFINAYDVALKGIRELGRFDPEIPLLSEGSTNDFFSKVADLKGAGSERVKFDIAKLLTENIIVAENTTFGEPDAIEYSKKLGAIMQHIPRKKASRAWRLLSGR